MFADPVSEVKYRCYISFAWAIAVLFVTVGVFVGSEAAPYLGVGIAIMWTLNRIVREAIDGYRILKEFKAHQSHDEEE